MNLVIVESPTKAKKLKEYLGKDYVIEASVGHVRDLPKSKLGVDVAQNFQPTYDIIRGSGQTVSKLKSLAKKAEHLYLATDPDREGEAIAWHLLEAWDDPKLQAKSQRAVFHEITKDAVQAALAAPRTLNQDLVNAQQARRVLDRLVGYQLSPVLWRKVRRGLSAGRVQSVALRLIVEREKEIIAFQPEEYWEVDLQLGAKREGPNSEGAKDEALVARVTQLDGQKYEPHTAAEVEQVQSWAAAAHYTVSDVEKKQRQRSPFAPFTTSTLQQAAANRLGFTAKRTMQLAQQLYEEGLITYHRTDSTNLAQQAVQMARAYIKSNFGEEYVPKKPNVYAKKSKNAQEAHEAIRPTQPQPKMASGKLTEAHAKLYDLIFRRFIASQMTTAVYDLTVVTIDGQGSGSHAQRHLQARVTGSVITHAGWMTLFPGGEDTILPVLTPRQALDFQQLLTAQKFTQPPPRFNDASLVKELEKRGIGRPSTYASIISVILARGYVERVQKALQPTAVGTTVIEFLLTNFPAILDYDFTAHMENDLDDIALGQKEWTMVMKDFYGPFAAKLSEVADTAARVSVPVEPLQQPCPQCGLSAVEFAQATQDQQTMATMSPTQRTDTVWREQPHGELVIRVGRFGKFISCSRYPECDFTDRYQEKIDAVCPQCGAGDVVVKKTKKGRTFYGCSRYPECDYASWQKPGTREDE